ncbi:MAG: PKD domain-containing protein [Acidobacteriota bacterium]
MIDGGMMMRSNGFKHILGCLLVVAGAPLATQAAHHWARVIGGNGSDIPRSVQQTSDGGYVLAGITWGSFGGDQDAWLVKLDASGVVSWQKTFGGAGSDWARSVRQTADGGYYLGCYSLAFGNGVEAWVLRLDSAGSVVWQRTYGGTSDDYLDSLEVTGDGGCVFTGDTTSFGAGGSNAWAVKLSPDGTVNWAKRRYVDQNESGVDITPDGSGGYAMLADAAGGGGDRDAWFTRLDSNGNFVNNTRHLIGSIRSEVPQAIDRSGDGGWYVSGYVPVPGNANDGLLMKLNSTGSPVWQKHVGGPGDDHFRAGQSTSDGGYVAVGESNNNGIDADDLWVVKFDSSGSVVWQRTYGGVSGESGADICQTSDGGYVVAGETTSYGNAKEVFILRLSPNGEIDPSCGGLIQDPALASADWGVSDDTGFTSWTANTTVTVATPAYATNNTNAGNTVLCVSTCQVSCSATVPAAGVAGNAVAFQANATLVDCDGLSVSYSWTFGDGGSSAAQNPSHIYGSAGTYPWTLTASGPGATPCLQSGLITISTTAMPDLTGTWTSVKKKRGKVNAKLSSQNTGLGEAGSFTVKVYFSNKVTIGRKSKLLKTQAVSSLTPGGSVLIAVKATPTRKHKYIVAVVDSAGAVAETNEANNAIAKTLP